MKLYEFTYNDNTNRPESEVLASLAETLKKEAELQGWAPGYSLHQCQKPVQLPNGEKEFFFAVEGEALPDSNFEEESEARPSEAPSKRDIAASP